MHGLPTLSEAAQIPLHATIAGGTADLGLPTHSQSSEDSCKAYLDAKARTGVTARKSWGLTSDRSEHPWAPAAVAFNHVLYLDVWPCNEKSPEEEGRQRGGVGVLVCFYSMGWHMLLPACIGLGMT